MLKFPQLQNHRLDWNLPASTFHSKDLQKNRTMIYATKFFLALLSLVAVAAVYKFPLKKISDHDFVAGIRARAAEGKK
jgi:hypothetical protein